MSTPAELKAQTAEWVVKVNRRLSDREAGK